MGEAFGLKPPRTAQEDIRVEGSGDVDAESASGAIRVEER